MDGQHRRSSFPPTLPPPPPPPPPMRDASTAQGGADASTAAKYSASAATTGESAGLLPSGTGTRSGMVGGDGGGGAAAMNSSTNNNEDAFSSSSEEDEDNNDDEYEYDNMNVNVNDLYGTGTGTGTAGSGDAEAAAPRSLTSAASAGGAAPSSSSRRQQQHMPSSSNEETPGKGTAAAAAAAAAAATTTTKTPHGAAPAAVSEWDKALQLGRARHVTVSVPAFEAPTGPPAAPAAQAPPPPSSSVPPASISKNSNDTGGGESDHRLYYRDGPTPSIEVVPSRDNEDSNSHSGNDDDEDDDEEEMKVTRAAHDQEPPRGRRAAPTPPTTGSAAAALDSSSATSSSAPLATQRADDVSSGVLPDVLMEMRQRIESLQLFDSDILRLADPATGSSKLDRGRRRRRQQPLRVGAKDPRRRLLPPPAPGSGIGSDGGLYPPTAAAYGEGDDYDDEDDDMEEDDDDEEYRESLKRSSQQSISAAVLVSLAHKRYERRRLAAMELEKICRALLYQGETERIRAILLLLSDDYVRSTSEDARKGGVVALAACAIALKRGNHSTSTAANSSGDPVIDECRDLILASVVHACQDHSSRVRYYATESLFNVVKVMPALAVQHFFILFEILRSLYADVDADVRSGAELLDRKLKEVIVAAMNAGTFAAEVCLPVFCRFVYLRHKATKQLTLSWFQELHDKLLDQNPILEFLHLFLGGVFDMVADPAAAIRDAAIHFLQSVLPKLLRSEDGDDDHLDSVGGAKVDFDKILQSLVTTMEHPDPFVRKVSMHWMSRIVKSHCDPPPPVVKGKPDFAPLSPDDEQESYNKAAESQEGLPGSDRRPHNAHSMPPPPPPPPLPLSPASISVRHSLPHILPGILLSIGDDYEPRPKAAKGGTVAAGAGKDTFLPEFTTRELAQQTNDTLQAAVRRDGPSFVPYLDGFIVALREELDSPGADDPRSERPPAVAMEEKKDGESRAPPKAGLTALRYPPPVERSPYRIDVKQDGTGIESPGWFSSSAESQDEARRESEATVMSRLCALDWVVVLYESVVPILLKPDYAREFVYAIIHQLMDGAPRSIVHKSLEVLAKITVPAAGEAGQRSITSPTVVSTIKDVNGDDGSSGAKPRLSPMNESNISYAFDILEPPRRAMMSRNREVFAALIDLYSLNMSLMDDLSSVIAYMCRLQPPEFVFVSFSVELDRFLSRKLEVASKHSGAPSPSIALAADLRFVSSFIQNLTHVLLNQPEAKPMRDVLRDCARSPKAGPAMDERARQRSRLFHILLHSFAHNLASTISLCVWAGAYRTTYQFLSGIDPLDINLMFLLEVDRFIEHLERPLFRHLHVRMLEVEDDPDQEGSGSMLFKALKALLMILPQSTCYHVLRDRLVSVSRFRQGSSGRRTNLLQSSTTVANSSSGAGLSSTATGRIGGSTSLSSGPSASAVGHGSQSSHDASGPAGVYLSRVREARALHCETTWCTIRSESLDVPSEEADRDDNAAAKSTGRLDWLGYASEADEAAARLARRLQERSRGDVETQVATYSDLSGLNPGGDRRIVSDAADGEMESKDSPLGPDSGACRDENCEWKTYWETSSKGAQ